MSNTTFADLKRLQEGLAAESPEIGAELTTFPSGNAMLDVRRGGRGFVLVYSPGHGFGVDELHPDDGFVSGYRFLFTDLESAAHRLRVLALDTVSTDSSPTILSLLVLQCSNIQSSRDFYSLLGLSFVEEQHGTGPRHFAATIGSLVLEIYPCQAGERCAPVRLGFRVSSLDQTMAVLGRRGARIVREPKDSPWGRRAVVEDPDGNRIELA